MSHVTTVECLIESLDDLRVACQELGLELVEGVTTYKWWGTHVGDYPIPKGFKVSDLGKCDHVIRVPNNSSAFEIGVVKRKDGKEGYTLIYDFYGGRGRAIEKLAGKRCTDVVNHYCAEKTRRTMQDKLRRRREGWRVTKTKLEDGTMKVVATR